MKLFHVSVFFILLLGYGVSFTSCKHNNPEPNPCDSIHPVSADFKIEDEVSVGRNIRRFEVDTIGADGSQPIYFTATDTTAQSYEWKIGSDTRVFNTRSVALAFDKPVGSVSIRLITRKQAHTECNPHDDGADTLTKSLVVLPTERTPILGSYEGYYLSNPSKKSILKIALRADSLIVGERPTGEKYVLDGGGDAFLGNVAAYSRGGISGWIILNKNKKDIRFDCEYLISKTQTLMTDTFVGTRKP